MWVHQGTSVLSEPVTRNSRRAPIFAAISPDDPAFYFVVRALLEIERFGFDADDPEIISRAIVKGRDDYESMVQHRERLATAVSRPVIATAGQLVYYMRIGNRCKIGYTTNLSTRMVSINPEELLATEPGTVDLEHLRHREFGSLRTHGEWFRLEDPLTSHIERLRAAS